MSFAQLGIYFGLHNELQVRREMRQLVTSSAASARGEPLQMRFEQLETELRQLRADDAKTGPAEPRSTMPLSRDDFDRMMKVN